MSEQKRDPLWGQDTSRWAWWQHVLAWAIFAPIAAGVIWIAPKITAAILPF